MKRFAHLARRFFGALRPGGPSAADTRWVDSILTPEELSLWQRMKSHDRRHSVAVARRVEKILAGSKDADPRWCAVALLHDVGKLDSGLGVFGRVGATVAGGLAGHDMAAVWSQKRGITRRVGLYLRHPELGATRIRVVGGREEAARWAEAHHDEQARVALDFPEKVTAALYDADDD
jgi:hypothetical protein